MNVAKLTHLCSKWHAIVYLHVMVAMWSEWPILLTLYPSLQNPQSFPLESPTNQNILLGFLSIVLKSAMPAQKYSYLVM